MGRRHSPGLHASLQVAFGINVHRFGPRGFDTAGGSNKMSHVWRTGCVIDFSMQLASREVYRAGPDWTPLSDTSRIGVVSLLSPLVSDPTSHLYHAR